MLCILDSFDLIIQNFLVFFIVSWNIVNWVFWWYHSVFFMCSWIVNAIDTKKLLLILAIKGNEVRMKKTLLRKLVLVTNCVKIEASTEILFLVDQSIDVFDILLLQEDSGLSRRVLIFAIWNESFRGVREWLTLFTTVHGLFQINII